MNEQEPEFLATLPATWVQLESQAQTLYALLASPGW